MKVWERHNTMVQKHNHIKQANLKKKNYKKKNIDTILMWDEADYRTWNLHISKMHII